MRKFILYLQNSLRKGIRNKSYAFAKGSCSDAKQTNKKYHTLPSQRKDFLKIFCKKKTPFASLYETLFQKTQLKIAAINSRFKGKKGSCSLIRASHLSDASVPYISILKCHLAISQITDTN